MRRLIHVPIVHNAADLGSLSGAVRAHYVRVCGNAGWNQREQTIRALWTDIRTNLDALRLDAKKVRVYQDGLPICGFEPRIVRELAGAGSANHQLILELLDRGATLMGTEDPQLLLQEYELQKRVLGAKSPPRAAARDHHAKDMDRVLCARDAFIVRRIADTLEPGETGVLFLGALHRLDALGSTDIRLETLGGPVKK
jgi:hypothetical protein